MDATTILPLLVMVIAAGFADVLRKQVLQHVSPFLIIILLCGVFSVPSSVLILAWNGWPTLSDEAWRALIPFMCGTSFLLFAYYRAMQLCDVSVLAPIMGVVPALVLGKEVFFDGRHVSALGWLGILCSCVGAYALPVLGSKKAEHTMWRRFTMPLRSFTTERGMVWAMIALTMFVFVLPSQKRFLGFVRAEGQPVFTGIAIMMLLESVTHIVLFVPVEIIRAKRAPTRTIIPWGLFAGAGAFWIVHILLLYFAFSVIPAGYAMAIRSLGILVSVTLAGVRLRENIGPRLPAVAMIVLGVCFLSLWG